MKKAAAALLVSLMIIFGTVVSCFTASAATEGKFTYNDFVNGTYITDYSYSAYGDLVIPRTLGGNQVVGISPRVFLNRTGLTSVSFPEGLVRINYDAFKGCSGLKTIGFSESVETIESEAFQGCSSVKNIVFPAVRSFGERAFADCTALEWVVLSDAVEILDCVFDGCTSLTDIWYQGSEEAWEEILLYAGDEDAILTATIHYNTCVGNHAYSAACDTACDQCGFPREAAAHSFDHVCDTDCNNCGMIREVEGHKYDNACDAECNKCGTSRAGAGHKYDAATCVKPKTCSVCNATSGKALGHQYDNSCDDACNRCGQDRAVSHDYSVQKIKPATLTDKGNVTTYCSKCNRMKKEVMLTLPVKTIALSETEYTYNGKVITPTVNVKDERGVALKKGTDYTLTYASGRKNAGTYKVTVKLQNYYSGSKTLTFKINPAKVSSCTAKLSTTAYTYDGKVKTPAVTVTNAAGTKLKKDTDYTVTYPSGRKNAGTYKVTVKMKGNYTGTKTLTYKINPIAASKVVLKAGTTTLAYSGEARMPVYSLKNAAGAGLKKGTDYVVKQSANSAGVGKYTFTVALKGNYSGTKSFTYTIAPTLKTKLSGYVGDTLKIGAKSNKTITYTTSNKKVAIVNSKGVITAKGAGTATITVKSNGIARKISVKVTKPSVVISGSKTTLYRGNKLKLKAKTNLSGVKIRWSVSNKKIATITSSGTLAAKKLGTVTVTAKFTYKGKTYKDTYKVKVKTATPKIFFMAPDYLRWKLMHGFVIENRGDTTIKVLNKGYISNSVNKKKVTKLYAKDKFRNSITVAPGDTFEINLYFGGKKAWSDHQTHYRIYFECDGKTYYSTYYTGDADGIYMSTHLNKCVQVS